MCEYLRVSELTVCKLLMKQSVLDPPLSLTVHHSFLLWVDICGRVSFFILNISNHSLDPLMLML